MKSIIKAVAVAVALAGPLVSFAQTNNQPLTRAQVRADLERVEKAGYNPLDWEHYPENIQAAEARIAAQNATQGTAQAASTQEGTTGVGGTQSRSESGRVSDKTVSPYSPPIVQHN